jgi:hypothetical protein
MTIVRADEPSLVSIRLEFLKPFVATNTATFTFTPHPAGTTVTWAMDGRNTLVSKAVSLVLDMDAMIGGDFERGLLALKALAEGADAAGAPRTAALPPGPAPR